MRIVDVRLLAAMIHQRLVETSKNVIHVPTEAEHLFIVDHGKGRKTLYRLTETTITNDVTVSHAAFPAVDVEGVTKNGS